MMFNKRYAKKYSPLLLLISTMIWGSAVVITKDVLQDIPFIWILTLRSSVTAILLNLIFWKRFNKLDRFYLQNGIIMGIFLFLGYGFQTMGLSLTSPSKSAFLTSVYCVLVPLLYWLIDHKRPNRYNIIAGVLCLTGIGFISLERDLAVNYGDILTLMGSLFFGLNIIVVAKSIVGRDIFLLTTLQFTVFAFLAWSSAVLFSPPLTELSQNAIWQILYLAIFGFCVGFLLQYEGQKYMSPSAAAVILALEAPFTVICSILAGWEILTYQMIIGFVLIFIAIICSETKLSFLKTSKRV